MFGLRTVRRGERIALWSKRGEVQYVDGPRRVFTVGKRVEILARIVASPREYLVINYCDGRVEHRPGPASIWRDLAEHESIEVKSAIEVPPEEAIAVYVGDEKNSKSRLIEGRAVFIPSIDETVSTLTRFTADPKHYLVLKHKDGRREHLPGPASILFDSVIHQQVQIEKMLDISANEAIVVYRQEENSVDRRVVKGPAQFAPTEKEWLHLFSWHGADKGDPTIKVPHALRFYKLRVIPDQMYFDVRDVRTADDALLVLKFMVFFELVNIERMLDQTHDPIADFINALSADVIDFVSSQNLVEFKEKTECLNDLKTYLQLVQRAERIGYRVTKVVYRGYLANEALQTMHDSAIESRTRLLLEAETEKQAQELEDMKMQCKHERDARQREMDQQEAKHLIMVQQLEHEQKMKQSQIERDAEIEHQTRTNKLAQKHEQAMNLEQVAFLNSCQEMGIDLTRYLVAQYQHPDRLIRIDGADKGAQMHLHDN